MQALGDRANYVEIDGSGPNALDFHIAYYIGELATADPTGSFHVISKDKGSDPIFERCLCPLWCPNQDHLPSPKLTYGVKNLPLNVL